jgi:biopolymer transport protein ExbB
MMSRKLQEQDSIMKRNFFSITFMPLLIMATFFTAAAPVTGFAQGVPSAAAPAASPPAAAMSSSMAAVPPVTPQNQPDLGALALLPDDLSPWGMFLGADIVVKTVIIGLAIASVACWTIWLAKTLELIMAKRRLKQAYRTLREAGSLTLAAARLDTKGVARAMVLAAREEWRESANA